MLCEFGQVLRIGPYEIHELLTGTFCLDGGAMFGAVPKTLWSKTNPADESNRIDLKLRSLLIRKAEEESQPARNILIDCGIGTLWPEKLLQAYRIDPQSGSMVSGLARHGLKPEDITDLILTHLHFDHAGGLVRRENIDDPGSSIVPVFPNATVYLQKSNWENARQPNEKERASYRREIFSLYETEPSLKRKLTLLESSGEETLLPGITVQPSNGHTRGMQILRIADREKSLFYTADLIPTATHVRLNYVTAYDCFPLTLLEEKRAILDRAAEEKSWLFYEHCPRMSASRVIRDEKGNFSHGEPISI